MVGSSWRAPLKQGKKNHTISLVTINIISIIHISFHFTDYMFVTLKLSIHCTNFTKLCSGLVHGISMTICLHAGWCYFSCLVVINSQCPFTRRRYQLITHQHKSIKEAASNDDSLCSKQDQGLLKLMHTTTKTLLFTIVLCIKHIHRTIAFWKDHNMKYKVFFTTEMVYLLI